METAPLKVFISYAHWDRETCEKIAGILKRDDRFDVWYDAGLVPGEVYRKRIVEIIRNSDYFIILISRHSTASEWVFDEVEYAKKLHKKILPIHIEETEVPDDMDMIIHRYHSLFWHLRLSDQQFENSLHSVFDPEEAGQETDAAGYGCNEFSEAENERMRELLEKERQGLYSVCYSPENACLMGQAYFFGGPCAADPEKAKHYFKISAYFGSKDATFYLLQMKLDERRKDTWDEPDLDFCKPIVDEIESLADSGSIQAKLYLANICWYGKYGCPRDVNRSAALYEECARLGNPRAQYMMASYYYYGRGVPRDFDLAMMYANLAVEQKYFKGWRRWGKFYRDGLALKMDCVKSKECYERGARAGDYNCYNKIGDLFYYGRGFEADYQTAFSYYQKGEQAPLRGQRYALSKAKKALGRCYENGFGVEKDLVKAAEKYLDGYKYGDMECREFYVRCIRKYQNEAPSEEDCDTLRQSYEKSALAGDYNCYNKIGDLYFYGKGCPVDYKTAVACYQKGEQAPDGGHAHALRRAKKALGQCYENGLGVEQDYETAAAKYLESYLYGEEACFEAYERCIKKTAELK